MLIALAWPTHVHHRVAHAWFGRRAAGGWATCPMTQAGFVRISSNPRIVHDAVSPRAALELLEEMTALPGHHFWPDDIAFTRTNPSSAYLIGHRQVTDAYLLALAIHHQGRLVTLDAGIASMLPAKSSLKKALEIVPAT